MLRGFKALKHLFITVDGRPPIIGNSYGGFPGSWTKDTVSGDAKVSASTYWKRFKLTAKEATREQKWEKTAQGIYMCIYIYLNPVQAHEYETRINMENKRFAVREPRLTGIVRKIVKALTGIVFEKEVQIVAMQVFKEYDEEQRIEIFTGIPKDWEGIEYDLQKAE